MHFYRTKGGRGLVAEKNKSQNAAFWFVYIIEIRETQKSVFVCQFTLTSIFWCFPTGSNKKKKEKKIEQKERHY